MNPVPFEQIRAELSELPEPKRSAMIRWFEQKLVRDTAVDGMRHPAQLGQLLDPDYRITPAIELISRAVERATTTPGARLMVTMPPQEGKSYLTAVLTPIRCLQRNPDARIILASYASGLAEDSSRMARNLIAQYGTDARDPLTGLPTEDRLGLSLADDKATIANWRIKGHKGGMIAVGMGGTITGKPADILIIDDPIKGIEAADSPTERRKVIEGFQANLSTRLAPGAPIILIQTRWHEQDLAGWLLQQDAALAGELRRWEVVNIPAVSSRGLPDALGRPPGKAMVSARGRTPEEFAQIRRDVGERVWAALYLGSPLPLAGGLFSPAWFDLYRLSVPPTLYRRVVAVDPAETGHSDEAGIVAGGMDEAGRVILTHDWSGHMTSDIWARKACLLALSTGATELLFEAYSTATTYERVIKEAYKALTREAYMGDGTVEGTSVPEERPFRVVPWRAPGGTAVSGAVARSAGLRQGVETGRARLVGYRLATLEHQAVSWLPGQHCPDRVSAAVIVWEHLAGAGTITVAQQPGTWGQMPTGLTGDRGVGGFPF